MEQPILDRLTAYQKEGCYPWHMPGHKRRLYTIFPRVIADPFSIDVTEVEGLDDFHHPEGIIREAWERAAMVYGSHKSYYLVNGTTGGILAAVSCVCRLGDCILVARNCHKSVYNAVRLLRLKPVYIMPEWLGEWDMFGGIAADMVEEAVDDHPEAKALVLVSPTYEGVASDIKKIAEITHRAGIPLIVDAAHGAHFEYMQAKVGSRSSSEHQGSPMPAIRLGADLVVESLHKTLPAMTQCAILHENSGLIDRARLEEYLSIYQSSSPSYVFMTSIEACIEKMDQERNRRFAVYQELLEEYRKRLGRLSHIHLMEQQDFGQWAFGYDEGKLVFSVKKCGLQQGDHVVSFTGTMLADILHRKYRQMVEMAGGSYVIAMTSVADSKEAFDALSQSLEAIDRQLTDYGETADTILYGSLPEYRMDIAEAMDAEKSMVSFKEAAGRVSGAFLYAYPPGIPIIAPGEVVSTEILGEIERAKEKGLNLKGISGKEEITVLYSQT